MDIHDHPVHWSVMVRAVVHNQQGRILRLMSCQRMLFSLAPGESAVEVDELAGISSHTHYVNNGEIVERPDNPARLQGLRLVDVPVPSILEIEAEQYQVDDPVVELEFETPGVYPVRIRSWPYKDVAMEVAVEDPA